MNWHLEVDGGRHFESEQNLRLQQMRREVETLETTACLMRNLLDRMGAEPFAAGAHDATRNS